MRSDRALRMCRPVALALFAVCAASVGGVGSALAASADKGKVAFVQHGCWQCHGYNGQSTVTSNGRVIARTALPLDAFKAFVRGSNGAMPPYRPPVLSDDDLDDIYAYLQAIPQPKSPSSIPLLGELRSQ
jgi:ubiquinol-cytochrome c reductase cytochrome c subunit